MDAGYLIIIYCTLIIHNYGRGLAPDTSVYYLASCSTTCNNAHHSSSAMLRVCSAAARAAFMRTRRLRRCPASRACDAVVHARVHQVRAKLALERLLGFGFGRSSKLRLRSDKSIYFLFFTCTLIMGLQSSEVFFFWHCVFNFADLRHFYY